ncbi:MAG TPA: hypothetical protein DGR97_10085 [Gammaproteobacteria bacterium]|nr:hypothetical protein [Gammaproteobacteria bacterium]
MGAECSLVKEALKECNYNVYAASRRVRITRLVTRYRMKRHGIAVRT